MLAAIRFAVGGAALLVKQDGWRRTIAGAAATSAVMLALFWNGRFQRLDDQGLIGLLFGVVLLLAVLVFRRPRLTV